ncbi:MAG TPA: hypothetical protein VLW53_01830, partial [Candidatus Eisenbacteria bacterium]|nr:hypothetical protein [Candidatus Eisenbacteria bacterium]
MTGTADPGGHGRRRPGPLARIGHDPDALEAFYTEHVTAAFYTLTETELTPAQQAALFRTLAGLPHLHLVKGATDALGRTGIGIAYS